MGRFGIKLKTKKNIPKVLGIFFFFFALKNYFFEKIIFFLGFFYFFQKEGINNTITVAISKRPRYIARDRTSFAASGK